MDRILSDPNTRKPNLTLIQGGKETAPKAPHARHEAEVDILPGDLPELDELEARRLARWVMDTENRPRGMLYDDAKA